ncbi:non-hydrolyzing UDP-N-acetylglucosamine 2-epimerase [Helicobacter sp. MIT 14-3879]|uniref:non-hydrolyzing UDP-N-acetylglucosamine 2-epimerase n=1 Tax=Helicobacter sp. MIT 14-3879 TaxID=2040649 RepID=UPI000E1F40BB|nr:UDP-N-acetylglucosamine 2-epimerase (non-hydrolyzing) [Helicobacter sp. MIT 14-3879]RDU61231.1 UDP-N-acetylglucosamine 2-epimerase (non-hydrolyzing) [Helicobacter sp. MIT 14-3879]
MKKILFILGTRPEVIKLAPLYLYFKSQKDFAVYLCNTEQQKHLSRQTLRFFNIKADFSLNVMKPNQSLPSVNARLLTKLDELYEKINLDAVIIQGDTMSAYCGALSAFYRKIPIFHIEAGLRSGNIYEPFPEEAMRLMISKIASLHFCPTKQDAKNLLAEGIHHSKVFVTQNTVIDAFSYLDSKELAKSTLRLKKLGLNLMGKNQVCLVTLHRRENHDKICELAAALQELARCNPHTQFILPLHPNPNVRGVLQNTLSHFPNIILTESLNYIDLINVLKASHLVLTDSGGIQEEAPSFKVKVLVLRNFTERIAGVQLGFSELVGNNKENIIQRGHYFLNHSYTLESQNPYGDGLASQRIYRHIKDFLGVKQ